LRFIPEDTWQKYRDMFFDDFTPRQLVELESFYSNCQEFDITWHLTDFAYSSSLRDEVLNHESRCGRMKDFVKGEILPYELQDEIVGKFKTMLAEIGSPSIRSLIKQLEARARGEGHESWEDILASDGPEMADVWKRVLKAELDVRESVGL
jgi:hypothetical protein